MAGYYFSILILLGVCVVPRVVAFNFSHHMQLDPDGKYHIWWLLKNETITIKVTVKTTGWIGCGISPNGAMKGADMVIGWVDVNGNPYFSDRHARGHHVPLIDGHQDYVRHQLFEENGETTMIFSRKIETCDQDDNPITEDTMRVLYAWNDEDPLENKHIAKHTSKGSKSVLFSDYSDHQKQNLVQQYNTFDIVMANVTVPVWKTAYWCKAFKLPNMTGKQHLIQVDPIITPGNENIVHHMILYGCEKSVMEKDLNIAHNCFGQNMPDLNCGRNVVIHGWAIGGTTYYYPKDIGLPLNVPGAPKYLLIEIHYDNPNKRSDIVDSSGLRFVYTDELRTYDASLLQLGIQPSSGLLTQLIPQKQRNFTSYGFCRSDCLDISSKKHYIFGYLLHTHTTGKSIIVRLIRDSDNVEVKRIAQDLNYDFNFQEVRHVKEPIEIPPGHSIYIECIYNTEERSKPVLSGLGTEEEMCLAYLFIYPKLNLITCYSASVSFLTFGIQELDWTVDQYYKIASSLIIGGKDYKGQFAYKPLEAKEFWENKSSDFIRKFELAGAEEAYRKMCVYNTGSKQIQVTRSKTPLKLKDETECNDVTAFGRKLSPSLLVILVMMVARNYV